MADLDRFDQKRQTQVMPTVNCNYKGSALFTQITVIKKVIEWLKVLNSSRVNKLLNYADFNDELFLCTGGE